MVLLLLLCAPAACTFDHVFIHGDKEGGRSDIPTGKSYGSVPPITPVNPYDDRLRLNHLQLKGTHNSYHIALEHPYKKEIDYTHAPLDVQLSEQGIRQIELDIHYHTGRGFLVYHSPKDPLTTCAVLVDCLKTVKNWSDDHPGHHALFIFLQPYSDTGDLDPESYCEALDSEILSVWPRERLLIPDDVQDTYSSLRKAVRERGWPTLGETRNKAVFVLLDYGSFRDAYARQNASLAGRMMFVTANIFTNVAAFIKLDQAFWYYPFIRIAVGMGFMVRTRSDHPGKDPFYGDRIRLKAALSSGAHIISTDNPAPLNGVEYDEKIPGGNPSRCNPRTSPRFCTSEMIEMLNAETAGSGPNAP